MTRTLENGPLHTVAVQLTEKAWGTLKSLALEQYRDTEQQAGYLLDWAIAVDNKNLGEVRSEDAPEERQPGIIADEKLDDATRETARSSPTEAQLWPPEESDPLLQLKNLPAASQGRALRRYLGYLDFARVVPPRFHSPKSGYLTETQDRIVANAGLEIMGDDIEARIANGELAKRTGISYSGCRNAMKRLVHIFEPVVEENKSPIAAKLYTIEGALSCLWDDWVYNAPWKR